MAQTSGFPSDWRDRRYLLLIAFLLGYAALLFYRDVTGSALAETATKLVFPAALIALGVSLVRRSATLSSVLGVAGVSLLSAGFLRGFAVLALPVLTGVSTVLAVLGFGLYILD